MKRKSVEEILAEKLFEAGQKEKRNQPKGIWGEGAFRTWRDLPSESVRVWEAVAICAMKIKPKDRWT